MRQICCHVLGSSRWCSKDGGSFVLVYPFLLSWHWSLDPKHFEIRLNFDDLVRSGHWKGCSWVFYPAEFSNGCEREGNLSLMREHPLSLANSKYWICTTVMSLDRWSDKEKYERTNRCWKNVRLYSAEWNASPNLTSTKAMTCDDLW